MTGVPRQYDVFLLVLVIGLTGILSACSGGGSDADAPPSGSRDSSSAAAPSETAPEPTDVTCLDGEQPRTAMYDHPGYDTFSEMSAEESRHNGAYVVDRSSGTTYFLRDDGTAHTAVPWSGKARTRWFPSGKTWCADDRKWATLDPRSVVPFEPVRLEVGHCWIEPVEIFGGTWDVMAEDQFGWGGPAPDRFAATGTAYLTGDVVTYVDDSGPHLTLVPEGDPWALERRGCD